MHNSPAHTSSESSSKESYNGRNSHRVGHRTRCRTLRNRNDKSSESASTVPISDTDSRKKTRRHHRIERLDLSEYDSDHSSQRALQETYKTDKAIEVVCPVNYCYK